MFPVEQSPFGNADALGELALRQASLGPDPGDVDHRNLNGVDTRAGILATRKSDRFAQPFDQFLVKLARLRSP